MRNIIYIRVNNNLLIGGVLDRVDSLITVAFGISIIIILISNTMLTGNPFLNHTPSDTLLLIGLLV